MSLKSLAHQISALPQDATLKDNISPKANASAVFVASTLNSVSSIHVSVVYTPVAVAYTRASKASLPISVAATHASGETPPPESIL